jgi:hypothetical protein
MSDGALRDKPGAWVDLGLTLPIFVAYHAGVIFLRVQNATDPITRPLLTLAEGNRGVYLLITASIGVVFAAVFGIAGRGQAFRPQKFVQIAVEGVLYAVLMRMAANYVVGNLFAAVGGVGAPAAPGDAAMAHPNPFVGLVMSLGAGFYEELAFRVLLFGLGTKILVWYATHRSYGVVAGESRPVGWRGVLIAVLWSFVAAGIFSGVHYVGPLGDAFALPSFLFRVTLGLALTLIFVLRGFAAAVWAHALYDIWVLVF